jgi:hypothetical protein
MLQIHNIPSCRRMIVSIFYLPEFDKTMAEISLDEKNKISHRAKAARKAQEFLTDLLRMGGS